MACFRYRFRALLIILLLRICASENHWRPCVEIKRDLRIPCTCAITVSGALKNVLSVEVNCDRVVLTDDYLPYLDDSTIISFSQKFSGHRNLPITVTSVLPNTVEFLDFSDNAIHRLSDRLLRGRESLKELRLSNNALGDNVNPIFSSNEFHELTNLKLLDLRSNGLRSIEEGIFAGCGSLEQLYLDFNNFTKPPVESLKGPRALKILSLAGNNIESVDHGVLSILGESLVKLNFSHNEILRVEDGAFTEMKNLMILDLSHNFLQYMNSDALKGAYNLQELDISTNFLENFPTAALRHQKNLRTLNISNNLITELEHEHMNDLTNLQILDLSRNNIERLGSNVFTDLTNLVHLDLGFNVLLAIDESSFRGLDKLKWLSIKDNNILLMPSSALDRLQGLTQLHLDFNRIAALESDSLRSAARHLTKLSLSRNLVRELPSRVFSNFEQLSSIDLSGNIISILEPQSFAGVEDTLIYLDLSHNRLGAVDQLALGNLLSLNLSSNRLTRISADVFRHLVKLERLDLSDNPLYGGFPPLFPQTLRELNVARTDLQVLPSILLLNLINLERVSFAGNKLQELTESTFGTNHFNLTMIDLSYNSIAFISKGAFMGLKSLKSLNLAGNKLRSFGAEDHFLLSHAGSHSELNFLNLSGNAIQQFPARALLSHPRLRELDLSENKIESLSGEAVRQLQYLERLNLAGNNLSFIGELAFSKMSRLRELWLTGNLIERIEDLAFHNSSQLQKIDLSGNRLETMGERALEGLQRLEKLDLAGNRLDSLPDGLFSRLKLVESIDLSDNRLEIIPVRALQGVSGLVDLRLARNSLAAAPQDVVTMMNGLESLDVSGNTRLSEAAIKTLFGEAKLLRRLVLSSCNLRILPRMEAPHLRRLDLRGNVLEHLDASEALERSTLLEELDVSMNRLQALPGGSLPALKHLNVSGNDVRMITADDSEILGPSLKSLSINDLKNCTRIEGSAFARLTKLHTLRAFGYPRLGYLDWQSFTRQMARLELLDVELKDLSVGGEQPPLARSHPRLSSLTLRGDRLRTVLPSLLLNMREPRLTLAIKDTSVSLSAGLLSPLPRSTRIEVDLSGSKSVPTQLLPAFDERNGYLSFRGLNVTLVCDCTARGLWKWRNAFVGNFVVCSAPKYLIGRQLADLTEDNLSCAVEHGTSSTKVLHPHANDNVNNHHDINEANFEDANADDSGIDLVTRTNNRLSMSSEPMIIWTAAPSFPDSKHTKPTYEKPPVSSITGSVDDVLIIGIILAILFLILIIVATICVCRLRCNNAEALNEAHIRAAMASGIHPDATMLRPGSSFGGGKLNPEAIYMHQGSYNGSTLGHIPTSASPVQMLPLVQPLPIVHSNSGSQSIYGYYDNPPYYVTSTDNKYD